MATHQPSSRIVQILIFFLFIFEKIFVSFLANILVLSFRDYRYPHMNESEDENKKIIVLILHESLI